MKIDTAQILSISEANRNFSKATHIADERGETLIFKNNKLKYRLVNVDLEPDFELSDDEIIDVAAKRILQRFKPAFMELAK